MYLACEHNISFLLTHMYQIFVTRCTSMINISSGTAYFAQESQGPIDVVIFINFIMYKTCIFNVVLIDMLKIAVNKRITVYFTNLGRLFFTILADLDFTGGGQPPPPTRKKA